MSTNLRILTLSSMISCPKWLAWSAMRSLVNHSDMWHVRACVCVCVTAVLVCECLRPSSLLLIHSLDQFLLNCPLLCFLLLLLSVSLLLPEEDDSTKALVCHCFRVCLFWVCLFFVGVGVGGGGLCVCVWSYWWVQFPKRCHYLS